MKDCSIAIALFAWKRPEYLKKALDTHTKIPRVDYHAFVDHSEIQGHIANLILKTGMYRVHKTKTHLGLNTNIRDGIDYLFKKYDAVIVLEDDLLLTPDSLPYLAYELTQLKNDERFGAVSCVKGKYGDEFKCWAWGTWKDRWSLVDWTAQPKKKNRDSWDMIVAENFRRKGWYCRCSDIPRVKHIGWSGIHYKQLDRFSIRRVWKKLSGRI